MGKRTQILIIEKVQEAAQHLLQRLKVEGYAAECSSDVVSARKQLGRGRLPDIVLIDWQLTGEDLGVNFVRELRKEIRTRYVPSILVSTKGLLRHQDASGDADCQEEHAEDVDIHITSQKTSEPQETEEKQELIEVEDPNSYVCKYLSFPQLLKRIRWLMKRNSIHHGGPPIHESTDHGGVVLDCGQRSVRYEEQYVILPPVEFRLMRF